MDARTSLEAVLVDLDALTALSGCGLSAAVQNLVPCCYLLQYLLQEGHAEPLVRAPSPLSARLHSSHADRAFPCT